MMYQKDKDVLESVKHSNLNAGDKEYIELVFRTLSDLEDIRKKYEKM